MTNDPWLDFFSPLLALRVRFMDTWPVTLLTIFFSPLKLNYFVVQQKPDDGIMFGQSCFLFSFFIFLCCVWIVELRLISCTERVLMSVSFAWLWLVSISCSLPARSPLIGYTSLWIPNNWRQTWNLLISQEGGAQTNISNILHNNRCQCKKSTKTQQL